MTLTFDAGSIPDYSVRRTGGTTVTVQMPAAAWQGERKPDIPSVRGGKIVASVKTSGNSLLITTKTKAFGFIKVQSPDKPQVLIQFFRDPIGARWKPPSERKPLPQVRPEPRPAPKPRPGPKPAPKPAPKPVAEQPAAERTAPAAQPQVTESDLGPEGTKHKPFFSVPHTVRTSVAPPPGADNGTAAHAMRFKATDKDAEEVKLAELEGADSARAPVVALPGSEPLQGQGDAGVRGSVVPPPAQMPLSGVATPGDNASAASATVAMSAPPAETQGESSVSQTVSPPQDIAPPVHSVAAGSGAAVSGAVAPPPDFLEDSGQQAVAQPEVVEEPAPAPEQVAESAPDEAVQQENATDEALPEDGADAVAEDAAQAQAEQPLTEEDNATRMVEKLRNDALEAQSLMINGNLLAAKEAFEKLLPNALLPDALREEALYSLGDINMQLYSADPADKFDEIAGAYTEALNYNPDSPKAPRALVNLGLINLKVGNLPEAKAYFSILQNKYPDDQVIPSISYYWGEYYFRKGEYRKAADQLQYLVQTYPENELVKDAAFLLAQALERIGYDEQAFQIVDYIDKRWPDYYMARPEYLLLAGGIEMRLKKYALAKDHYFTYYNLNPEAESADIALGRIGDIYLTQGFKQAAREIYEKAARDYPDKEGGLVSKMRLAEEGIYDDPTMVQMVSVFDRPYTLRPVNVYEDIVEKYPDSPLAPVAQLKLAMWYAFHKKYADALGASQDFIDKFPGSDLKDRARALGDKVFALAVPQLVEEGNYKRVLRYWESYDFIGKGDTKVDDNTRLMVATSYWKMGQPDQALEIIKPYLGDTQIPDISSKAIDLAVGIYLDQYAWDSMNKLVDHATQKWKLEPRQMRQLKYARAMALQNMGEAKEALPLWAELGMNPEVDPAFRGYAMYYMAKDAMKRQDLKRVFAYAQEALTLLLQTDGDPEKVKDAVLMSIYATERSGRYEEALKWAREYDRYITPENPEWAPTRFKLARIYKKAGAIEEWKKLLQDIIDKRPDSLQSSLAQAALDNYAVENQAREYSPAPQ
ncbi:tetratricopeptide repeat protein [Pseudodesulfovibrio senegalensis]|uniref:Tetratricopeptide repeat protein n=2 Tax=Pseudodesulfovibrio senegalensis TaxID=1721087 RepID=A0A6N6N3P7_9BACT|nr:tetratricopeptide repeat protein [Pseudodesulfovibrio senegalensis]